MAHLTITQPCATLTGALAKTNAGGEISILDPGPYNGPLTIGKPVTISSVGAIGTIVAPAGSTAITVNAGASDIVILRGLSFDGGSVNRAGGATVGVHFLNGGRLHVEHCTFFGFAGEGLTFQPAGASALFVANTSFKSNGGGAYVVPGVAGTASATFSGVRFENGFRGIRSEDGSTVLVRNSVATGNNSGNGFVAFTAGAPGRPTIMTIENSTASFNGGHGVMASGATAVLRLSNVTAIDNGLSGAAAVGGGVIYSFGANRFVGNAQGELGAGTTLSPLNSQ